MKFLRMNIASASLALALATGSIALGGDKDNAALAKAPAAVQAAAKKALGDKKLEEFGKESIGGKIVYEVGFKADGVDHAYIISEAGELVQEEADVDVAKLPAAVLATVKKAQPHGKIDEAAMATAGDKHFYEVDVKVGKEIHAIKVALDGKLIADEIEKPLKDGDKPDAKEKD
ncbi:MAG: hypothetical protein JWO87_3424 [Phycisphaerales bacterium]|jgi:uncharacterized membrane protein YkoI|nr:hypothetical protein [Phycisphaerales bacterium]MDB5301761.1 hypothetical protein [Phycisphaerales bacterium]MDB5303892.1 hypothetical protein [Phycisphaerales bacterium]